MDTNTVCKCNHILYDHGEDNAGIQDCRVKDCICDEFEKKGNKMARRRAWVGRNVLPEKNIQFESLEEAEAFVAQVELLFPKEVHAGELYIDAEEVEYGRNP